VIGIVHGVNVPGQGGLIQVFLSADPRTGAIGQVFFQRLESAASRALRSRDYLAQFKDLTLADFYRHDYYQATKSGSVEDKVARIKSPVSDEKGKRTPWPRCGECARTSSCLTSSSMTEGSKPPIGRPRQL